MHTLILNRNFELPADGWYHIAPLGEFPHAAAGVVQVIDPDACRAIVNAFRDQAAQPNFPGLLIDFDHFSLDRQKPSEAAGWICDVQFQEPTPNLNGPDEPRRHEGHEEDGKNRPNEAGLWAQIRWSDRGEEAVMKPRITRIARMEGQSSGSFSTAGSPSCFAEATQDKCVTRSAVHQTGPASPGASLGLRRAYFALRWPADVSGRSAPRGGRAVAWSGITRPAFAGSLRSPGYGAAPFAFRSKRRLVGATGFEPATPWSRTKCSTRLSHAPKKKRPYATASRCGAQSHSTPGSDRRRSPAPRPGQYWRQCRRHRPRNRP